MYHFNEFINKPCFVPVKRLKYEGGFDTEYLRGEFTGYSFILSKYCFSLYNGEVVRLPYKEAKQVFSQFTLS